jgi:hypothetical protein
MVPVLLLLSVPYILAVNAGTAIDLPTCLVSPPALFRFVPATSAHHCESGYFRKLMYIKQSTFLR